MCLLIVTITVLALTCIILGGILWSCSKKTTPESFTQRPRVVVSFTTIPGRVQYISEVAKELEKQTFKPDAIYACIPMVSRRFKENYSVDPENIPEGITVIRCKDYGPATKLLGCLEFEPDPETIIITVDEDQHYRKDLIESLVSAGILDKNKRVGSHARDRQFGSNPWKFIGARREETGDHLALEGFGGVLYRRGMITDEIMAYFRQLSPEDACWKADDITFDRLFTENGVKKQKIKSKRISNNSKIDGVAALRKDSRSKTYQLCLEELKEYSHRKRGRK